MPGGGRHGRHHGAPGDDAVNISPRTAQQQRFPDLVREMLDRTGLLARCLTLEITEHAIMDNADRAVELLEKLDAAGVRIAIDDFGTGHNSLVHLQRLPVSELKIDRSFVQDIESRVDSAAIARSVVGLAGALGLHTVAEGIEHPGQVAALAALGCHRGQGYLCGRATLPPACPACWPARLGPRARDGDVFGPGHENGPRSVLRTGRGAAFGRAHRGAGACGAAGDRGAGRPAGWGPVRCRRRSSQNGDRRGSHPEHRSPIGRVLIAQVGYFGAAPPVRSGPEPGVPGTRRFRSPDNR